MKSKGLKRVDFLTLFPTMFEGPMTASLLGKARDKGLIDVRVHNLRDWSSDKKHRKVDDRPFGGGAGMVIQAEPIYQALKTVRGRRKAHVIYMSPQGQPLTQARIQQLVKHEALVLLCGHYEGIDERAMSLIDEEVSIGDYVLTGGELPAMVLADAVLRIIPGVVKETASIENDSFQKNRLDTPHYTRPAVWRGKKVPEVLLSGHHAAIAEWREKKSLEATAQKRPDLLKKH